MGKGDRKTKRGKLFSKTYGNSRPRKATSATNAPAAPSTPAATTDSTDSADSKKETK